jgi:hypothetical protein
MLLCLICVCVCVCVYISIYIYMAHIHLRLCTCSAESEEPGGPGRSSLLYHQSLWPAPLYLCIFWSQPSSRCFQAAQITFKDQKDTMCVIFGWFLLKPAARSFTRTKNCERLSTKPCISKERRFGRNRTESLSQRLAEQFQSFTKFNLDCISRQIKGNPFSYVS